MNTKQTSVQISKLIVAILLLLLTIRPAKAQDIEGGGVKGPIPGGVSKAEKLYNDLSYFEAIPVFESYLQKHDSNATAMAHLGDCYRQTSRFDKAEYWYSKAVAKGGVEPKYKLYLAQMLQADGKYEEAAKYYAKYKEEVPEDRRSAMEMKACSDYGQFLLTRDRYTVKDLSFNSTGYDFASALFNDGLVYSSSRDSAKAISRISTWTGTEFFDMWFVKGDKDQFGKPERMKGDAATKYHEGTLSFTPDKSHVYFTRNNYENGKTKASSDKIIKLKIYYSEVDGRTWKNDKPFAYNNDEYSVGHPALTADGNTMYFVSDMPGGYGMMDIYVTKKDSSGGGEWGTPKNLGPEINTEGREMFPWVDSTGELFFASDAHGGLGGLDIFRVKYNETTGKWGKIKNIGAPINSSYDDFSLHYGKDRSYGYFSTNRGDTKGIDDIYTFTDEGIDLEGIVVDAITGKPICTSKVVMKSKADMSERGRTTTECDGKFEFNVVRNTDYAFNASADGYAPNDSVTATTRGVTAGGKVFVRIPLMPSRQYAMRVWVLGKTLKATTDTMLGDFAKRGLQPLANAKILLSSQCEGWTKAFTTDDSGKICEVVRCDCDYIVVANAPGYLPGSVTASRNDSLCLIDRTCGVNPREVEVILDKIPGDTGQAVELKDIYYDFDKWYIRKESEPELNKLLGFMQENAATIVEISSHTDARAPFDYNIRLSQRRAQSVVDWLVARGIPKKRLKPKGYGESKPRNGCTDNVPCTEYEHQRNRRTEFRVVGGDMDIKSLERFDMQVDPCKVCPF
ncbi:MAG: flagellar motor protein MotB [Bacteroidota bacterium]|nr:flagellar motor protein MotB [Bacteroidota bacterium]